MPKGYLPETRNAAEYSRSPMSFFMIKTAITVATTAGTINVFGPNSPDNTASGAANLSSSPTQRRPGHRLCFWRITGGVNSGGTGSATIMTFKTATVAPDGSTITIGGIIGRVSRIIDVTTTGGWGVQASETITPFAPVAGIPLVIGDPDCGITIVTSAAGGDGTVPIEIVASLVPTCIPGTI